MPDKISQKPIQVHNMRYLLYFFISLLVTNPIFAAQILSMQELQKQHVPASLSLPNKKNSTPVLSIPELDTAALEQEDSSTVDTSKMYRFAVPYTDKVSYNDNGSWTTIGDTAVWTLEIATINSYSVNLGFKNVFLPEGAKLFIYTKDLSEAVVFTSTDNKPHKEIWTPVFETEYLMVEINVPVNLKSFLQFDLSNINQGYRSIKSSAIAKSGSCNIDVVCSAGDEWRDEIRSVGRYTISGVSSCTGTLVNNVNEDGTPYFLTADHCGVTASTDASVVVYWNYETSTCGGTPDGSLSEFQSGSTLRAAWVGSDFTLLQLDSIPSASANVYYAGWDNSDVVPASVVGIHHPGADEKRISFDNDSLIITVDGGSSFVNDANYLRVGAWDGGTTERGSSGSGIWNDSHHIVGTLTSGLAACAGTVDNDQPDWYGRFAKHWTGNNTNDSRLSNWLDPADTGATSLNGLGATCTSRPSGTVTISANPADINEVINFSVIASGGSGGYNYAWDFNDDGIVDSTDADTTFSYSNQYQGIVSLNISDSASCTKSLVRSMIIGSSGSNSTITVSSGGGGSIGIVLLNLILLVFFTRIRKIV